MKPSNCSLLFVLFISVCLITSINTSAPSITFVSLQSATQSTATRVGSLLGGAILYLRGSGLSSDPTTTSVLISSTVCPIKTSLTSSYQIACTVPASATAGNFSVTVSINNVTATCDPTICSFTYDPSSTPVLQFIMPTAVFPNSDIYFQCISRVTSTSSLTLAIGTNFCDFSQYTAQTLSGNSTDLARCRVGAITVGSYILQLTSTLQGTGYSAQSLQVAVDSTSTIYDLIVIPQITLISNTSSPTAGVVISITGAGFSKTPEQNVVTYGDSLCYVLSSSYTFIECILSTPIQPTQSALYIGHAGINVKLYSGINNLTTLQGLYSSTLNSQQKLLSFEIPYNNMTGYSEILEGFFQPPITGSYRFYLSSQGPSQLYISTVSTSTSNLRLIAQVNNSTEFRNFFNPNESSQISANITLQAGSYYLLRAFHLDATNKTLTVGVNIPTTTRGNFSPRETISINITAQVVRKQAIFSFISTTTVVKFLYISGGTVLSSRNLTYPADPATLIAALADIGVNIAVVSQQFYDSSFNPLTSTTGSSKVQYLVTFLDDFLSASLPGLSDTTVGSFSSVTGNTPTSLVSGSYTLSVSGVSVKLQFNETADTIATKFDAALGQQYGTRGFLYGDCRTGCSYVLQFIGYTNDIPPVTLTTNSLAGGAIQPQVTIKILQDAASSSTFYAPIPYNLLYTMETQPQIKVATTGLLGSCTGSCGFTVYQSDKTYPKIIGYSISGYILTVNMANAASLVSSKTRVFFSGQEELVSSFNAATQVITVTLSTNSDKTPILAAGSFYPVVNIQGIGLAALDASLSAYSVQPNIKSISVVKSGTNLMFIVLGSGFGISLTRQFGTTATIGGITCAVTLLSNTQLRCLASLISTVGPFTVVVNGKSVQYPFVYGSPDIIYGLDVFYDLKNDYHVLNISGQGFSDNTTINIKSDETGVTDTCRICKQDASLIECSLRGLVPSNYTLFATTFIYPNYLLQSNKTFVLPLTIYSVSPSSGSQLGNTLLTIQGAGFSPLLSGNQVAIGPNNLRCTIVNANETTIHCLTEANLALYAGPQDVVVWYGLEFQSQCQGSCTFDYSDVSTPSITNVSSSLVSMGQTLTIYGTDFTSTTVVTLNNVAAKVLSVSSQELSIQIPDVAACESFDLQAHDPVFGVYKISADISISSALILTDFSPKIGSSAGSIITLIGSGFGQDAEILIGANTCAIISITNTKITCTAPASSSGSVIINQGNFQSITCQKLQLFLFIHIITLYH